MLDTGICHERTTGHRWMYRTAALTPEMLTPEPVHVWPVSGGGVQVLTMDAFNARFIVDYRFDLRRYV